MTNAIATAMTKAKASKASKAAKVSPAAAPKAEWVSSILPAAAQGAISGKALATEGRNKGAAALAVMVVGFASDEVAEHKWAFDMVGNDGQNKFHVRCTGTDEFGGTSGEWRAEPKKAQSAYKAALQLAFFGLPESNASVWTTASNAIVMARAIRAEGMTATIVDGQLKLEGGDTDKAKAMREAKSLAALGKVAKDETGTNRATPSNAGGTDETRQLATPTEILAAAAMLVRDVTTGKEAVSNAALSYARKIAELVAANPSLFSED